MPEAGYSGTPLPKKLGIGENSSLALFSPPPEFIDAIIPLPPGATLDQEPAAGSFSVIVSFHLAAQEYLQRLPHLKERLSTEGGLWIAWPKKASGIVTDLDFSLVQKAGLDVGLVDNKVCAIDTTWSGLRFVYRLKDRIPGGAR